MQLKDAIKKRRSVRDYSHKAPDWRAILRAIDMARIVPSAGNLYSNKFIIVSDKKKIDSLAKASQQDFVGTASYVVVVVSDESKLVRNYGGKGHEYAMHQAGASIQNFLLALTEEGLVTSWIGYFEENQVKRTLEVPDKMRVDALFPIGLETAKKAKEQKKVELENIIYFDSWGTKKMEPYTRVSSDMS